MKSTLHRLGTLLRRDVRAGFIVSMMALSSALGSALWAITALPFLPGHLMESPLFQGMPLSIAREGVPSVLSWFFIEYPYVSPHYTIRAKNHHTYIISDSERHRDYVVTVGQTFRRVEIYTANDPSALVHIFTPGQKRIIAFRGPAVVSEKKMADANLWMWRNPLWNSQHLKIYALADFWLDSPYKRFSCAGFVHKYLQDAGVAVPILDAWDMAKLHWVEVPVDELEPGDIIAIRAGSAQHRRFWKHSITHVGVYLGNGKIIHAATSSPKALRSWVRISPIEQFHGRIAKVLRPPDLL